MRVYQKIGFAFMLLCTVVVKGQFSVQGLVVHGEKALNMAMVWSDKTNITTYTNEQGEFSYQFNEKGVYEMHVYAFGYQSAVFSVQIDSFTNDSVLIFSIQALSIDIDDVVIEDEADEMFELSYLKPVEIDGIYASKKNEVLVMSKLSANKASNNARQIYSKVSGLTIWESDQAGLQLGIGARGLSPNRSSHFNTRQNGYDISADALGYPESYYTPPAEIIQSIQVVRGAASLQYGSQFGGLLNFKLKKGQKGKWVRGAVRQSVGSFALVNSNAELHGGKNKLSYYAFVGYKQGRGWREHSQYNGLNSFVNVSYTFSEQLRIDLDYTHMSYLSKQAGGLTDAQFNKDPFQATRTRNWFAVNWNVAAATLHYEPSSAFRINSRFFGLKAKRESIGYMGRAGRVDPGENRELIQGQFNNVGNETRLMYTYSMGGKPSVMLIGFRAYKGNTFSKQGEGARGEDADFSFLDDGDLLSDYRFPSQNFSVFGENLFNITKRFSITPGVRYEVIQTQSQGYYSADVVHPLTGNILLQEDRFEEKNKKRSIVLLGLGSSYKVQRQEIYVNFSQNYRAINFNDLRIVNPNFRIDENLQDERGWNADFGVKGAVHNVLRYDVSAFYLYYANKIGALLKKDEDTYVLYRYRTNIGSAFTSGVEAYAECNVLPFFVDSSNWRVLTFLNLSHLQSGYLQSSDPSVQKGNRVEFAPSWNLKSGITLGYKKAKLSVQYTYVADQFSEATNATGPVPGGIDGVIPAYQVLDVYAEYNLKRWKFDCGVNNAMNTMYFTRRATSYPGPGIIPSSPRNYHLGVEFRF